MARATIVHVITLLELGGAQEITLLTCRALERSRYRVHLVAGVGGLLDDEARAIPDLETHFCANLVREVSPAHDARMLVTLTKLLRRLRAESEGPLLVHTHSSKAGILGRWAAAFARADATVHSIHGFAFHDRQDPKARWVYRTLERLTAPVTDAFTGDSRANLDVAAKLGLLRGDKPALFFPPGIDPAEYRPLEGEGAPVRAELGCEPGTPLAGMLACLKPQKAPVDFVRVASRVVERVPNARFFIAGDGVLRPDVEAEIARCGLEGRFFLLGWRRDVRALLAAADVMVLTSLHEGLPRALIQALAAGRPIVASRVDGVPEAVEEGRNGHVLEPGDVAGFAERLANLMANPGVARRMGEEGAKRIAAFDWRRGVAELQSLYDRLLEATAN